MSKKSLTNKSGQVRSLTRKDIRDMKPAEEVLPADLVNILPKRLRGQRGPQKREKKVSVTLRYSPEIIAYFKKSGKGWQVRMNAALKEWIKKHPQKAV